MDKASEAFEILAAQRMNCAQAVLSVFCQDFGLDRTQALCLAQAFGGGMGRSGSICGAVTGAYMVLGLSQKISADKPRASLERTYEMVREFQRKFEVIHGSVMCRQLIDFDLNNPESLAAARAKKVFTNVCPRFVADAVCIVEGLLV